jgi:choline monooxygenase
LNAAQKKDKSQVNELTAFHKINFNKDQYGLFEIGVREFMGTLYVNLDNDKERRDALFSVQMGDLEENYGYYPWSDMAVVAQNEYKIEANYKMVAENFIEYYHLPWVHPELCLVSSVANHIRRQGTGHYMGFATYPLTSGGTPTDPDKFPHFAGINEADSEAAWFIQLFPNISYWIFPHTIVTLITAPGDEPGVCTEKFTVMMDKEIKQKMDDGDEETREKVKAMVDFFVMTNDQDIWAVENLQRGIQSSDVYRGGRLSAKFEETVYRYQQILIDYMTDQCMTPRPGDSDFVNSSQLERPKSKA